MRIPAPMRTPRVVIPAWLIVVVGGTVVTSVAFVVMLFPWHQIGRIVDYEDLPRTQSHRGLHYWWSRRGLAVDVEGTVWAIGNKPRKVEFQDVEDTIRRWRRIEDSDPRRLAMLPWRMSIRAHRRAPWSAVRRIMDAAARSGETSVCMELRARWSDTTSTGAHEALHLIFVDMAGLEELRRARRRVVVERITLDAVPLSEAESALSKTSMLSVQAEEAGKVYRPVVRLAFENDPKVSDVLNSLECYIVRMIPVGDDWVRGVCVTGIGSG